MPANSGQNVLLLYDRPAAADAHLIFGANYVLPCNDVVVQVRLPAPVASIVFIPPARLQVLAELPGLAVSTLILRPSVPLNVGVASLPGVVLTGEVRYASRTQRPTVARAVPAWNQAERSENGATQSQQDAAATPAGWESHWQRTSVLLHGFAHLLPPVLVSEFFSRSAGQQRATRQHVVTWFCHEEALHIAPIRVGVFQNAIRLHDTACLAHQDGDRSKRADRLALWQKAQPLSQCQCAKAQSASYQPVGRCARYQEALTPPPGISIRVVPEPPELPRCYTPGGHLLFAAFVPASSQLRFFCENHITLPVGEPVIVPIRRVYFVINNVNLHRLPDGLPVPVFSLSLSLDAASWTWGFDAQLPAAAENLVAPGSNGGPVELLVSVNGTEFRVLAEGISRERVFGDASIRISGRGHNAVLAAPYAPVINFQQPQARTARQLMDDALTLNGVTLGWSIDWGLTDWNVPPGVFTLQGTWMEALATIASTAGGYLIPHPSEQNIRVRHRYPAVPWEWSSVTPDFVLPVDALARESLRWVEKPGYNRVFVSGQDVGVLGQVTRAGTAGDILAPMVVDALITEAAAARQRGIAVLADTGQQIEVSLRLPVLAETGIIEPGTFVAYQDGDVARLGIVRSTQVEAGMLEVWQTLGVQSHV